MRIAVLITGIILLSACTSMLLGNGSSGGTSSSTVSDTSISERVRAGLAADDSTAAFDLSVRSYSGSVVLSGAVDSYVAREKAGNIAKATSGVRAVTNQIVVEK